MAGDGDFNARQAPAQDAVADDKNPALKARAEKSRPKRRRTVGAFANAHEIDLFAERKSSTPARRLDD